MRSGPLPVIILTGFLGSGKTTLLKRWLQDAPHPPDRSVLVINDFGPVNIDAALLAALPYELRSIAGGCVCCTSYGELINELDALADEDMDVVWLETSGLAAPEEVLDHLTDPALRGRVEVRRLVQVIDAEAYPGSWRHRALAEEQIRFADILVLSKADRVDAARLEELRTKLRGLNPRAEIVESANGEASPETLWTAGSRVDLPLGDIPHRAFETGPAAATGFIPLPGIVIREKLVERLNVLPDGVARAKGLVRLKEDPETLYAVQFVAGQGAPLILPLEYPIEPEPPLGLVVIGPALDTATLKIDVGEVRSTCGCE